MKNLINTTPINEKPLKRVLIANTLFSSFSGILLFIFNNSIGQVIGVNDILILRFIGIGLIIFAISIIWAYRKLPEIRIVRSIIIQDWAWVLGAVLIISLQLFNLTTTGYWILAGVSIPVAVFGLLQTRYS